MVVAAGRASLEGAARPDGDVRFERSPPVMGEVAWVGFHCYAARLDGDVVLWLPPVGAFRHSGGSGSDATAENTTLASAQDLLHRLVAVGPCHTAFRGGGETRAPRVRGCTS